MKRECYLKQPLIMPGSENQSETEWISTIWSQTLFNKRRDKLDCGMGQCCSLLDTPGTAMHIKPCSDTRGPGTSHTAVIRDTVGFQTALPCGTSMLQPRSQLGLCDNVSTPARPGLPNPDIVGQGRNHSARRHLEGHSE